MPPRVCIDLTDSDNDVIMSDRSGGTSSCPLVIDDTANDDIEIITPNPPPIRALKLIEDQSGRRYDNVYDINEPLPRDAQSVAEYRTISDVLLRKNSAIQYWRPSLDGSSDEEVFFYILKIFTSRTRPGFWLQGWVMQYLHHGSLKSGDPELTIMVDIDQPNMRIDPPLRKCISRIKPERFQVVKIITTNNSELPEGSGIKYCRWVQLRKKKLGQEKTIETVVRRLREDEVQLPDKRRSRSRRMAYYTYGDMFSGGGGTMSGASSIPGLKVKYGVDHDPICKETLEHNFPNAKVYCCDVHSFLTRNLGDLYVDILWLSPPCQAYSGLNNRGGKNDETNQAAGFCLIETLRKIQPRVVLVEQTSTFKTYAKFREMYAGFVRQFTTCGYSYRARIETLNQFGCPQARKRVIFIATRDTEPLYTFPEPTHGPDHNQTPYPTVQDILKADCPEAAPRRIMNVIEYFTRPKRPYNARRPLGLAVTGNGGDGDVFPDGRRRFTLHQLSLFQMFKQNHYFAGPKTAIRKQIGNAVPVGYAIALISHIMEQMRAYDQDTQRVQA